MLRLRQEQVDVLAAEAARLNARALVAEETAAFLAAQGAAFDESAVRACIARVVARGVARAGSVRRYLEIALAHGLAFEDDPALGWLVARLDDRNISSPDQRVERAHAEWTRRAAVAAENARREKAFRGA